MQRTTSFALIASLVVAVAVTACSRKSGEQESVPHGDEAVLTIGNRVVTVSEFYKNLKRAKLERGIAEDPEAIAVVRENLVREMIQTELILGVARDKGITVSHEEVAAEIARIRESYPADTFREMLTEQFIAYDEWVDRQKTRLTVEKVITEEVHSKIEVTDQEIREFYESHSELADEPEQVRVLQILVSSEEEARRLRARLEQGDDFAALAKEKSISPEARRGGELGTFSEGELPLSFEVVFQLKEGQISDVVQSEFGFHVFKVVERTPARTLTLDEARENIESVLRSRKAGAAFNTWLKGLSAKTAVQRNDSLLAALE